MIRPPLALLAVVGVNGSLNADQKHDLSTAAVQATPSAVAAVGSQGMGLALSHILTGLSITFIVLQIAYLVWKWRRDARREDERESDRQRGVTDQSGKTADLDLDEA